MTAATPLGRVLGKLGSVTKAGASYAARCPAHDDEHASLSVSEGDDGRVLVNCHAGCEPDDVLAAVKLEWRDLFPAKVNGDRRIVATYDYCDESGMVLSQQVRYEPKDFRQRRPDGRGGWTWNLNRTRRVLYRLPEVIAAVKAGAAVYVVEGEKDVDALERAGVVATCNPGGAGKWAKVPDAGTVLAGATVLVVADKDEPGGRHAAEVAADLRAHGCTVSIVEAIEGKDAADHLAAGHGLDEFVVVEAHANGRREHPEERGPEHDDDGDDHRHRGRRSASTVLVELASERHTFGISGAGETFAIPRTGPKVLVMLRGGRTSLRSQLARDYFATEGRAPAQQALADALLVIEGEAQASDPQPLHLRVAEHYGALWLDLGDSSGRAVKVTAAGWTVEDGAPVLFKRTPLTQALPEPVRGGDLDDLWRWLNVDEDDRPLIAAWLVSVLHPAIPHPIIDESGEQGSGKSTAAKALVSVVDPSPVPLRKPPRDPDSWVTAASGSWVVGIDNVSTITEWWSDSLCRAVTGDGDVRRRLYTDNDLAVFAFRRCIVLTGIDTGAVNGDLTDRLLPIHFDVIDDKARLEESELWPRWTEAHPRILGAVLDLAASVARVLPSVRLDSKPRMADFARIVAAVDRVLGTSGLDHYIAKQGAVATESLTADPFITAIESQLSIGGFDGTAAALLVLVTPDEDNWRPPKGWPTTPRAVTQRLHRQAPVMRKAGWVVSDDGGANKSHATRWTIHRPEMAPNPDSPTSPTSPTSPPADQASQASNEYGTTQDDELTDEERAEIEHYEAELSEVDR